nr:glutamyl-tRNA reductase [Brooklawnia cerclae]
MPVCHHERVSVIARTADHATHGLAVVERLTPAAAGLATDLAALDGVVGSVVVATCNRVEVLAELGVPDAGKAVDDFLSQRLGPDAADLTRRSDAALTVHLFRLACGLESQVVGEREINGQLRRALSRARRAGTASFGLAHTIEAASRASRRVENETGLAGRGRSIVAVGLDLVGRFVELPGCTVVLVGTGNYAGAVTAALHDRGVARAFVSSASGRAEQFADRHGLTAIADDDLAHHLTEADLLVTCRGFGGPAVPLDAVEAALAQRAAERPLAVLDLAVTHDVDARVADLPGVHVIDLAAIHASVPPADTEQVRLAEQILDEELAAFEADMAIRGIGPDIAALQAWSRGIVDAEIARLGDNPDAEASAIALRRVGASLVHLPTVLLRQAAAEDRASGLLHDLRDLLANGQEA